MGLSENGLSPQCCWFYQKHDESQVDLGDTRFFSDKSAYRYDGYVTNDDLLGGFKDIICIYLYVQTVINGMTIPTVEHLVQGVETTNQSEEQWRFRSKDYWLVRNHDRWSAKTAAFPRPFGVSLGRWVSAIPTSHQGNCGLSWRPIDWTNSMERLCTSPLSSLIKRRLHIIRATHPGWQATGARNQRWGDTFGAAKSSESWMTMT